MLIPLLLLGDRGLDEAVPLDARRECEGCGFSKAACAAPNATTSINLVLSGAAYDDRKVHAFGAWLATVYRFPELVTMLREEWRAENSTSALDIVSMEHGVLWNVARQYLYADPNATQLWEYILTQIPGKPLEIGHGVGHGVLLSEVFARHEPSCKVPENDWTPSSDAVARAEATCAATKPPLSYECASGLWMTYADATLWPPIELREASDVAKTSRHFDTCLDKRYALACGTYVAKWVFSHSKDFVRAVARSDEPPRDRQGIVEAFCASSAWDDNKHRAQCYKFVAIGLSDAMFRTDPKSQSQSLNSQLPEIIEHRRIPFIRDFSWCAQLAPRRDAAALALACIDGSLEPMMWLWKEIAPAMREHYEAVLDAATHLCDTLLSETDLNLRGNHQFCLTRVGALVHHLLEVPA